MKILTSLAILLFFIWILPLGAFIKPSQEKKACNGRRAICLCSLKMAKGASKPIYKNMGESQKEHPGPGGASHDFLHAREDNRADKQISRFHQPQKSHYALTVSRPIEHVPKA